MFNVGQGQEIVGHEAEVGAMIEGGEAVDHVAGVQVLTTNHLPDLGHAAGQGKYISYV